MSTRPLVRRGILLLAPALLGTMLACGFVLLDLHKRGDTTVGLIQPGRNGPSAAVVEQDFPHTQLPDDGGHDGQQFYAIARDLPHLKATAANLDRPRYRLQRIAFPALAWVLHPGGGGPGLVIAMFVVGAGALLVGGVATGMLAEDLGAPAWLGLLFPLLPGSITALRIGVGDALAAALLVAALSLSIRGHARWAVLAAVVAVLAKEPTLLALAGFAWWRRDRQGLAIFGVPAAVAAGWALCLRQLFPHAGPQVVEFALPFKGLADCIADWSTGDSPYAMLAIVTAVVFAAIALRRHGLRHPLGWVLAGQLAFLTVLNRDVLALERNGTRAVLPLLVLGALAAATPASAPDEAPDDGQPVERRSTLKPYRRAPAPVTSATTR